MVGWLEALWSWQGSKNTEIAEQLIPIIHQAGTPSIDEPEIQLIKEQIWHWLVNPLEHTNLPILSNIASRPSL